MSRAFRFSSTVLAALLVGGCGGGSDPPPVNFDVAAAVAGIAKNNEVFTLTGLFLGGTVSLQISHNALPDALLANFVQPLSRFRRTASITAAGTVASDFEDNYVDLATRTFYGWVNSQGNQALSTARMPYPATATVGNSGLLYDATVYDQTATAVGKTHVYWSLEAVPGNASAAYLCVNIDILDLNGTSTGAREHNCYGIATNGDRLGMRVTVVDPAVGTVVFQ